MLGTCHLPGNVSEIYMFSNKLLCCGALGRGRARKVRFGNACRSFARLEDERRLYVKVVRSARSASVLPLFRARSFFGSRPPQPFCRGYHDNFSLILCGRRGAGCGPPGQRLRGLPACGLVCIVIRTSSARRSHRTSSKECAGGESRPFTGHSADPLLWLAPPPLGSST